MLSTTSSNGEMSERGAADIASLPRLRALGNLERYSAVRHEHGFYNNVGVSASHRSPIANPNQGSLKPYVYAACAAAIAQHPVLSAVPVNTSAREAYFARLPEINLEKCVSFRQRKQKPCAAGEEQEDAELDDLIQTEHIISWAAQWKTGELVPAWRLVVLLDSSSHPEPEFTVVFIFHHALGDGTSGLAFHRAFSRSLHSARPSGYSIAASTIVLPPSDLTLLPSLEQSLNLSLSIRYLVSAVASDLLPWLFPKPATLWTGDKVQLGGCPRFRTLVMAREPSMQFAATCRANTTSVTAVLQTLFAVTLFDVIPENFMSLRASCPISLRPFLDKNQESAGRWCIPGTRIDNDSFGSWYEGLTFTYDRKQFHHGSEKATVIEESRKVRSELQQSLAKGSRDLSVGLLRFVPDLGKFFVSKVGKVRDTSFEISSLGLWKGDGDKRESERVGRIVFSQSVNVSGPAITMSVVTGGDCCMALGFTWQEGVVEDDLVQQLMKKLRDNIARLCNA